MAQNDDVQPTELELKILHVLWEDAPLPVREIRSRLAANGKELAHTSVITMLNIMVEKKLLKRTQRGNAYFFSPKVKQERVSTSMIKTLVDRVFQGSKVAVMQHLIDSEELDEKELNEIRKIIQRKLQERS